MNQVFEQHNQNVENHSKFQRCANVFKLAKLKCKSQNIRSIKSDRTLKRKEQLKINNDESIILLFHCSYHGKRTNENCVINSRSTKLISRAYTFN